MNESPLREIFTTQNGPNIYTIVQVSHDIDIELSYDHPRAGLKFSITPHERGFHRWHAKGIADSNFVGLLGAIRLPTPRPGRRNEQPLTENELSDLNSLGKVQPLGEGLFDMDMVFSVMGFYRFFHQVWRPKIKEEDYFKVPVLNPGDPNTGIRKLPEKKLIDLSTGQSSLLVRVID